jgi:Repeat of unknown function (DUF5648)
MRRIKITFLSSVRPLLVLALAFCVTLSSTTITRADSFNAGNIIDDSVFTNANSMSVVQIQNFLNSKVPVCDTYGSQASEYGGGTRAQWGQARYGQSTFTCLKDYNEGGRSAAQIIYDTAQANNINPQVLIVLLQKEQGLVTDTWPLNIQYRSATGYGCPDTAPCDSQYYGLTNQLNWAAKMFRSIVNASPGWYTPYILGSNFIRYSPDASCGGSNVTIANRSTQALYNYTPYQPNAATLAAPMGTTVACGAYGNINFYRYFTSWFGGTSQFILPGCVQATNTSLSCVWQLTSTINQRSLYVIDHAEAQSLINSGQYRYSGFAFIGRNPRAPQQNNIPVYSIKISTGNLLTADKNEYDTLKSLGYGDGGIAFYADRPGSNNGYPVYRLSSSVGHIFTSSPEAKDSYVSQGYTYEGIAFTALSPVIQEIAAPTGQKLVYRFGGMPYGRHFWTTDLNERDSMILRGYVYEGVSWRAYEGAAGSPIYRLSSPPLQKHLFTQGENEKNVLSTSPDWRYEGVAWNSNLQPNGSPVYRLYLKHNAENFLTTDANERSVLIRTGVANDEGIAWYQP